MKSRFSTIEPLIQLGQQLAEFGHDEQSRHAITQACEANSWFTPDSILYAVEAIRRNMLTEEALTALLSAYPTLPTDRPHRVGIIMAGNLPLVGFADLLYTIAAGEKALIKPSSKDPLPLYIAQLLNNLSAQPLISTLLPDSQIDALIATGSDNSAHYFHSVWPAARRLIRGTRGSVALLDGSESQQELSALGRDIFTYNGMGCRNVSLLLLPEGYDLAPMIEAIKPHAKSCVAAYHSNYRQTRALLTMRAQEHIDCDYFALLPSSEIPAQRLSTIGVRTYSTMREVEEFLAANNQCIQCVVGNNPPFPRAARFGQAQHPTLTDYADGVDVMEFLASLHNNQQ